MCFALVTHVTLNYFSCDSLQVVACTPRPRYVYREKMRCFFALPSTPPWRRVSLGREHTRARDCARKLEYDHEALSSFVRVVFVHTVFLNIFCLCLFFFYHLVFSPPFLPVVFPHRKKTNADMPSSRTPWATASCSVG